MRSLATSEQFVVFGGNSVGSLDASSPGASAVGGTAPPTTVGICMSCVARPLHGAGPNAGSPDDNCFAPEYM